MERALRSRAGASLLAAFKLLMLVHRGRPTRAEELPNRNSISFQGSPLVSLYVRLARLAALFRGENSTEFSVHLGQPVLAALKEENGGVY